MSYLVRILKSIAWQCGLLGSLACLAALPAAEETLFPPHCLRDTLDTAAPDHLAGEWLRLADGARLRVQAGENLSRLQPGAYRRGEHLWLAARSGGAADRCRSLLGLRSLRPEEVPLREQVVGQLIAIDQLALPIWAWRLTDGLVWPQVGFEQGLRGLPRYLKRLNPTAEGYAYNSTLRAYRSAGGGAMQFVADDQGRHADAIACGDLIAVSQENADEAVWGQMLLLVEDRGQAGVLDPEDRVVTIQNQQGQLLPNVQELRLGDAAGPSVVHCFTRHPQRRQELMDGISQEPPLDPDNVIWTLPRWRQIMVLCGMSIVIVVCLRNIRRYRRQR